MQTIDVFDGHNTCQSRELRDLSPARVCAEARRISKVAGVYKTVANIGAEWAEYERGVCKSATSAEYLD